MNECSLDKNLYGGVRVESNSLANMPALEDVTPVVNNLHSLKQLD